MMDFPSKIINICKLLTIFVKRSRRHLLLSGWQQKQQNNEICSKLTTKTPEWRQWSRSGAFIVNSEQISHIVLVFLLLIVNKQMPTGFQHKCLTGYEMLVRYLTLTATFASTSQPTRVGVYFLNCHVASTRNKIKAI